MRGVARGDGCGLVQGSHEEGETEDLSKARKEAHGLYEAGEKKWGTPSTLSWGPEAMYS